MKFKFYISSLLILSSAFFVADAQTVTLDYYFNHKVHTNASGQQERFHYLWEDKANTGFSIWGDIFKKNGARLKSLDAAPTVENLEGTNIYIIVDPDTKKVNPDPHYIQEGDIEAICKWVKAGGVLVMLANDSAHVELQHFNNLAARFGMHFNDDLQNYVIDDNHFEDGAIVTAKNPLFKTANKIFMKDVCSISITAPARAGLKNKDKAVVIAIARYGNGTVFAVGDPWFYNEYTNGRLPAGFENDKAAGDVAQWLLKQVHTKLEH